MGVMRICPECELIDRTMWRQNKWRTNVDFISVDYPEDIPPEVLDLYYQLHPYAEDKRKHYGYRLIHPHGKRKEAIIERVLYEEIMAYGTQAFHIPRENVKEELNPDQTRWDEWFQYLEEVDVRE